MTRATRMTVQRLSIADLWTFLTRKKLTVSRRAYDGLAREVIDGRAFGGFVDGAPVVIGGAAKVVRGGPRILWIDVVPGVASAMSPVMLIRATRWVLVEIGGDDCVAWVSDDAPREQVFVGLCGLVRTNEVREGLRLFRHGHVVQQSCEEAVRTGPTGAGVAGSASG